MTVQEADVLKALRTVEDPDLRRDIVSLGFVKNVEISGPQVSFEIELTTPACPVKEELKREAEASVRALPGVGEVNVRMTSNVRSRAVQAAIPMPGIRNVIAVASGKGGVGKSTASANLALALSETGAAVGLLDADIYGPSLPGMLGMAGMRPQGTPDGKLLPLEKLGLKVMSMGFLTAEDTPVIWRGPMVHGILQQFLGQVAWGSLDYLIIDLPPGTGDAQLTLTQSAPLAGAVIVTTPQDVSLRIARKGLRMFQKVRVPILGILENMSYFVCPKCRERHEIFRSGGGRRAAEELGIPFLGEIPIDPGVVLGGDSGTPVIAAGKDSPAAAAYREAARRMAAELSIQNMKEGRPADLSLRGQRA